MNDMIVLTLTFFAGTLLGSIFYGGLWWTVQKSVTSKNPGSWFLGSFLVRMGISLSGFYYVSGGHWERIISCLLGFILARIIITRITKPTKEVVHEN